MIIERTKVVEAYTRVVLQLGANHDEACASVAQSLALPVESVEQAVYEHDEVPS